MPDLALHPTPQDPPAQSQGAGRPGELRPHIAQVKLWTKLEIIQAVARDLGKKDACAALHSEFPDHSHRWFQRNFYRLMAMDVADFAAELVSDPTGILAARHLDAGMVAHV